MKTYTNGVKQINYGYNAENLRTYKTVNGQFTGYVWNGSSLAAETSDNAVTSTYTYGADGITTANINGITNIYLKNVHGDVVGITDANGTLQKSYRYDAFGNEQNPDENDPNPFRYCGEYFDKETDNIYLRNRYYNSGIGRFITEDPIRDGLNWYAYANNNPAKFFDPNGLSPEDDLILSYQQIWQDAEAAFQLNIISIYEKNSVQEFAHSMADELRYQKEHPILTAFNNITEFAVFDILLGDFDGGTVYAADFSQSAMEKMYDNEYNFSAIMATAAIVTYDKGRNLANVKINKQMVRVDIEYPQGGKPGNVHIQNKQTGEKWIIKKLDDIDNLPKSIAKDKTIKKTVSKALKALAKLF